MALSKIERNLLNQLSFTCQHQDEHGCEAEVRYEHLKTHLASDCKSKLEFPAHEPIVFAERAA